MTSYGALRQEIRGSGGGAASGGSSFTAYGAGKEGYAARAAMKAVSEGRLPPGAMILPGGAFEDSVDLPEGWDLKERPSTSKSFTGAWSHHPFILPAEEPHPQVRQKAQAGKEGSLSYVSLSRASERVSHREGPPAAKSSGSSGSLNNAGAVSVKEVKSSGNASPSDQPPPLSANNSSSSLRTSTSYAAPPASAPRPKPVSGAVPLHVSSVKRSPVGASPASPAVVAQQAPVAKLQATRPPATSGT